MAKLELPSASCVGYDAPDGTAYDAAQRGYVEIERPDHIAEIRSQGELRFIDGFTAHSRRAPEVVCRCGFVQLAAFAARPCPRCGSTFAQEAS